MVETKQFNGKEYRAYHRVYEKPKALKIAKERRRMGENARVTRDKSGVYVIWHREKRKHKRYV